MTEAHKCSLDELRRELLDIVGSGGQGTRGPGDKRTLPTTHQAIAWSEWQAAAAAEKLEIEREFWPGGGCWGLTVRRVGALKTPVPPAPRPRFDPIMPRPVDDGQGSAQAAKPGHPTPGAIAHHANDPQGRCSGDPAAVAAAAVAFQTTQRELGRAVSMTDAVAQVMGVDPVPSNATTTAGGSTAAAADANDAQSVADAARRYQREQRAIGESVSMTDAVAHVARETSAAGNGRSDLGADAVEIARRARALMERERAAGRELGIAEAVERTTDPRDDPSAIARRLQDQVANAAREGRSIGPATAARELGLEQLDE